MFVSMPRKRWLLPACFCLLLAAPGASFAQGSAAGNEASSPASYGQLADLLENEEARNALIEDLRVRARGEQERAEGGDGGAAGSEASGNNAGASEAEAETAEAPKETVSLSRRIARSTQAVLDPRPPRTPATSQIVSPFINFHFLSLYGLFCIAN